MTLFLDVEELLAIAARVLEAEVLVRDLGLLDAAVHRPQSGFGDMLFFDTFRLQAAALLCGVVSNHALVDGNKRLGWASLVAFCSINDVLLRAPSVDAAYDLVLDVAEHGCPDMDRIADTLDDWMVIELP